MFRALGATLAAAVAALAVTAMLARGRETVDERPPDERGSGIPLSRGTNYSRPSPDDQDGDGIPDAVEDALVEEHALRDGRILNDQFSTYIIPTPLDTPEIATLLVEHAFPWGPYGAKGLGETPIIAVAPAVTAAIAHATGVRLREIPATPERVWRALRAKAEP